MSPNQHVYAYSTVYQPGFIILGMKVALNSQFHFQLFIFKQNNAMHDEYNHFWNHTELLRRVVIYSVLSSSRLCKHIVHWSSTALLLEFNSYMLLDQHCFNYCWLNVIWSAWNKHQLNLDTGHQLLRYGRDNQDLCLPWEISTICAHCWAIIEN